MKEKKIKSETIVHKDNEKVQGALFLAIAVAAVLSLGVFTYLKVSDIGSNVGVQGDDLPGHSMNMEERVAVAIQEKLPMPRDEMTVPSEADIKGKWFTTFGDHGVVEIWFGAGKYELVYTTDPNGRFRKYSKGNYRFRSQDGQISLFPSSADGAPEDIPGVAYQSMSMRNYEIYLKRKPSAADLYFMAPEYQVRTKSYHPIFVFSDFSGAPVLKFSSVQVGQ